MLRNAMILTALLTAAPGAAAAPPACNGVPGLCARPFDEVTFATTHNAMASSERGYIFPNQRHTIRTQLTDGIRGLMLDVHRFKGRPALCHGVCELGSQDLVEGLEEIAAHLDTAPRSVVTLLLEVSGVSPGQLAEAFAAAGLRRYCYAHPAGAPWPTLGAMVERDKRLVVLTDGSRGGHDWLHPMWDLMWDTDWKVESPAGFDCERSRGSAANPLFNLNHFLTAPLPAPWFAEEVNQAALLRRRIQRCAEAAGQVPNFVTVDFYAIGDVVRVVQEFNHRRIEQAAETSGTTASARASHP